MFTFLEGLDTIDQDLNLLFCSCPHFCQFVSKLGYGLGWTNELMTNLWTQLEDL